MTRNMPDLPFSIPDLCLYTMYREVGDYMDQESTSRAASSTAALKPPLDQVKAVIPHDVVL